MTVDEKISAVEEAYPGWRLIHGGVRHAHRGLKLSVLFIRPDPLIVKSYTRIAEVLLDIEQRTPTGILHQWKPEVALWCAVYNGSFEPWLDSALDYFRNHIAKQTQHETSKYSR